MITIAAPFISHDASFATVVGTAPQLVRVASVDAHEGPVYVAGEDALYVTTVPAWDPVTGRPVAAIKRISLHADRGDGHEVVADDIVRIPADVTMPNGMTLDRDGRLVICEQGDDDHPARISRLDLLTGELTTVVDQLRGFRLSSPNDVVVAPDGGIWFTDPGYGYLQGFRPEPMLRDFVYRWDARSGRLEIVGDGFDKPNGIALSPDGTVLYVADSGADQANGSLDLSRPHEIVAYDVVGGRLLASRRRFAEVAPGAPDGLKVDADGRVYCSSAHGVQVRTPDGRLIGEISLPGAVNFTFGGPDGNVLFITADDAVWAAVLDVTGPRRP
jgi:gluconolactonase